MNAKDIKEYGLSIGYCNVGITSVASLDGYYDEMQARSEEYSFFMKNFATPVTEKMPEAKSVIVLVRDYFQNSFPDSLTDIIGKVYLARAYNPPVGNIENTRLNLMKGFLSKQGMLANSDINVPARLAGQQAGVTTFGRNTFAFDDDAGSYIMLYTIVVDAELEYDTPNMEDKCPPNCKACINACPTNAIYEPYKQDPRKCIPYSNWINQERWGAKPPFIPLDLRDKIGQKVHGCDICQDVCPRNHKKLHQSKPADKYIEKIAPEITLTSLLHMDDEFYFNRVKPLLYPYIKDKRYLIRNAAIAMGNSGDKKYIDDLKIALNTDDPMVREFITWAINKLEK